MKNFLKENWFKIILFILITVFIFLYRFQSFKDIISALLTPIIAIFLAYIAYRDHRLRKEQFKLNLYNRRYKIYKAVERLLKKFRKNGKIDLENLKEFETGTNERDFLFDDDVLKYIDLIRNNAIKFWDRYNRLNELNLPSDNQDKTLEEKRKKLADENCELSIWLINQLDDSRNLFKKYLKID